MFAFVVYIFSGEKSTPCFITKANAHRHLPQQCIQHLGLSFGLSGADRA